MKNYSSNNETLHSLTIDSGASEAPVQLHHLKAFSEWMMAEVELIEHLEMISSSLKSDHQLQLLQELERRKHFLRRLL